jgi:hypothetical protein
MNHEYLHIIRAIVLRYDLHQSASQMIRWSENVVLVGFFLVFWLFEAKVFSPKERKKGVCRFRFCIFFFRQGKETHKKRESARGVSF